VDIQRRHFLATASAVAALAAVSQPAHAWKRVSAEDVGLMPASGTWAILEHVTDGTDPSAAITAPANFTPEIRTLAGTDVVLTGYLQNLADGPGDDRIYLLTRETYHCRYCYPFGRGSLVLAAIEGSVPDTARKITVKGRLTLHEADASLLYFLLNNATIV